MLNRHLHILLLSFPLEPLHTFRTLVIVGLSCGLVLLNVLFVLQFTHSLLSVTKLSKDNKCDVLFGKKKCVVVNSESKMTICIGQLRNNLYNLSDNVLSGAESKMCNATSQSNFSVNTSDMYTTWRNRFGHASDSVLKFVDCVKPLIPHQSQVCLICPMSKFTKLPLDTTNNYEIIKSDSSFLISPLYICWIPDFK